MSKDYDYLTTSGEAMVMLKMIRLMLIDLLNLSSRRRLEQKKMAA